MGHQFCGHENLKEAALCMRCNPKRLTENEFRAVLGAMLDPRIVDRDLARILAELDALVARLEYRAASKKGDQK
jgi:hypothetical protein